MMTVKEILPQRLRQAREMRNMTQQQLSSAIGINANSSIAKFETGERLPSAENIARLSIALNVDADYLLGINTGINYKDLTNDQLDTIRCLIDHWGGE